MYLSARQCGALDQILQIQASACDPDHLREALASPMLTLLDADTYVSKVWSSVTSSFGNPVSLNVPDEHVQDWMNHYHLVDPLTKKMMAMREPVLSSQIMPRNQLIKSEFYQDFLRTYNQLWGVNVYFFDGQSCVGDFRIWRYHNRDNFDSNELEILRMISPAIAMTLSRLQRNQPIVEKQSAATPAVFDQGHIGNLSRRESEVASAVARGLPDKEIAREMGSSVATVRFHLSNVFTKWNVNNRAAVATRVSEARDIYGSAYAATQMVN